MSIAHLLDSVEQEHDVRVCLAVESGSRAWGFPSTDSDYDVRFIYVHRQDRYLSIDDGRDVIERPLTADLIDLSGWDIRKALRLFRKSNPPLLEWLQCPIVYREQTTLGAGLRGLMATFCSPETTFHHYASMARGNYREFLHGDVVRRKKYLYVLRPVLAMRWIADGHGPPPIEFARLVERGVLDPAVRAAIDALVAQKRAGQELDDGPADPVLNAFIDAELDRLTALGASWTRHQPDDAPLNQLFRRALAEAW